MGAGAQRHGASVVRVMQRCVVKRVWGVGRARHWEAPVWQEWCKMCRGQERVGACSINLAAFQSQRAVRQCNCVASIYRSGVRCARRGRRSSGPDVCAVVTATPCSGAWHRTGMACHGPFNVKETTGSGWHAAVDTSRVPACLARSRRPPAGPAVHGTWSSADRTLGHSAASQLVARATLGRRGSHQ